jgi:hypothetical protein
MCVIANVAMAGRIESVVEKVMNVEYFFLGNSPASEFHMPTFRNTLLHLHTYPPVKMGQSVPKRRHIKFRRRGITQKKAYNIQNTAKV